jgi:hypothetical protein
MSQAFNAKGDSRARGAAAATVPPVATVKAPEPPKAPPMDPVGLRLEYSVTTMGTGPLPRVMQAQRFTPREAAALQALHASLNGQSARMGNGKHVERTSDVFRKFLGDVADQLGLP